ncbi:MAG TPA: glycoside hydrolase family 15 protein [Thermomicrobiales bacterium]|nr:glycoside hydrolase family 15 protein [Thermomicrobiales bacterium]
MPASTFPPISDYGFLSDCHSAALVTRDASIEWACFNRFDRSAVFARILDRDVGGWFRIAPRGSFTTTRRYVPETLILETTFTTPDGVATVTDFLALEADEGAKGGLRRPGSGSTSLLIRIVRGVEGTVPMRMEFHPRFEYGLTTPRLQMLGEKLAFITGGADQLGLYVGDLSIDRDLSGGCTASFEIGAGEQRVVALAAVSQGDVDPEGPDERELLACEQDTTAFWQDWASRATHGQPYHDAVIRSALTLKGLTFAPTGAVIAAATTSLPEEIGGVRNWDYRFSWIRDSAFTLRALAGLGYEREVREFGRFIYRTSAGRANELQIMYGIGGERLLHEYELDHLSGYRDSRPVRVGNGAWNQIQLDIYGELLAAVCYLLEHGHGPRSIDDPEVVRFIADIVDTVEAQWEVPDEGIWEVRGGKRHFLYSKLLAWVAIDRAIRIVEHTRATGRSVEVDVERWAALRDRIRAEIETRGVAPDTGVFTQSFGSTLLDASALLVPVYGFLPYDDPRVRATVEAIDRDLTSHGHVFRYLSADGLHGAEGAFTFCTLWLAGALAGLGRVDEARERLELVLSCANDLGLLSEEIEVDTGEPIGNFPQAFSHLGVVWAARAIAVAEEAHEPGRGATVTPA